MLDTASARSSFDKLGALLIQISEYEQAAVSHIEDLAGRFDDSDILVRLRRSQEMRGGHSTNSTSSISSTTNNSKSSGCSVSGKVSSTNFGESVITSSRCDSYKIDVGGGKANELQAKEQRTKEQQPSRSRSSIDMDDANIVRLLEQIAGRHDAFDDPNVVSAKIELGDIYAARRDFQNCRVQLEKLFLRMVSPQCKDCDPKSVLGVAKALSMAIFQAEEFNGCVDIVDTAISAVSSCAGDFKNETCELKYLSCRALLLDGRTDVAQEKLRELRAFVSASENAGVTSVQTHEIDAEIVLSMVYTNKYNNALQLAQSVIDNDCTLSACIHASKGLLMQRIGNRSSSDSVSRQNSDLWKSAKECLQKALKEDGRNGLAMARTGLKKNLANKIFGYKRDAIFGQN